MSLWLDIKYAKLISARLPRYREKGLGNNYAAAFRCVLCGDSKKNQRMTRGSFYVKDGNLYFGCFNCGAQSHFGIFLKNFDSNLYKQLAVENFKEKMDSNRVELKPEPDFRIAPTQKYIPNIFEELPNVKDLDESGKVYQFCLKRKLPIDTFDFYYADNFIEWTKGNTDHFKKVNGDHHARLIIPWFDKTNKIVGYSARDLSGKQEQKYIRIFLDDQFKERAFGLNRIDWSKTIYVLEGEIDSLMIPNAVAVANGKLQTYMNKDAVYIPDSDTRNPHIMNNVQKMIDLGLKVCLLPDHLPKDLNEMVQAGMTQFDIMKIINDNTYEGLRLQVQFNKWKRV